MKKSSNIWNIRFLWLGGLLILYVLFQFLKKKAKGQNNLPSSFNFSNNTQLDNSEIFNLINKEEGFNPVAVKDGKDKNGNQLYTIGIGHQIQPSESYLLNKRITEEEAREIYEKDIKNIIDDMRKNIKVPVNKNQFLALLSLRYNIGPPQFNSSSLLRVLNEGDYLGASQKFKDWRLSEGKINSVLVARRERERVLFLKPV